MLVGVTGGAGSGDSPRGEGKLPYLDWWQVAQIETGEDWAFCCSGRVGGQGGEGAVRASCRSLREARDCGRALAFAGLRGVDVRFWRRAWCGCGHHE